jgi:hypothetical protein
LLAVFFFLHVESPKRKELTIFAQLRSLDPLGAFFFMPSMVSLVLALQWGGTTYAWSEPRIIGLLVTFSVLFVAFVVVEVLTPETAMAPTRIILNRSVAGSMLFMFLLSGGLMSVVYYLTLWFQAVKNDSAMHAGISTIPLILSFILIGIISAVFTQKIGYYTPAMLLSPLFASVGAGMLSTLKPTSGHGAWMGYQILYGFGVGLGFQTSTLPAQNVLRKADVPIGLALQFFMQQLGGAVFLAISQNIFASKLVTSLSDIAGLDAKAIVNTGATDLRNIVPSDKLQTVINAYSHALTRIFVLTAALSAIMILCAAAVEWKKLKGKSPVPESLEDSKVEDIRENVSEKS